MTTPRFYDKSLSDRCDQCESGPAGGYRCPACAIGKLEAENKAIYERAHMLERSISEERQKYTRERVLHSKTSEAHESQVRYAVALRDALQECAESLEDARGRLGMSGEGDHKDRKATAPDDIGSGRALRLAREALRMCPEIVPMPEKCPACFGAWDDHAEKCPNRHISTGHAVSTMEPGPELGRHDKLPCDVAIPDSRGTFSKGTTVGTLLDYLARRSWGQQPSIESSQFSVVACAERMPKDAQECIFLSKGGYWHAGRFLGEARMGRSSPAFVGHGLSMTASTVTHWAPLPNPHPTRDEFSGPATRPSEPQA